MSAGELMMTRDTIFGDTDLHVKVAWREDRVIVAVTGEVDVATAPLLSIALDQVTANSSRSVEIDLSGTSFFACRGLSVLTAAHHRLTEKGAALIVRGAVGVVRRAFTASGLHALLTDGDCDRMVVPPASLMR
jgi:anti-sigma B factor antagonist